MNNTDAIDVRFGPNRNRHLPDILDVIAALSSDLIPTPPVLARSLLNLLPNEVWSNPNYKWLDPATKSGSILREVARRLMIGLQEWQPDPQMRAEHILREMLHGCGCTLVHAEMTRRSVYISRDASTNHSAVPFETPDGNIPFIEAEHDYPTTRDGRASGPCRVCSAPPRLERGDNRENYAYAFIHGKYPTEEMREMKFDVIIGNPPYQTGDGRTSESPLYHYFVEEAIEMNPRYLAMIIPSRWFSGGKGLDDFRSKMINDRRVRKIVDNPKIFDCFPGVKIRGGVNYFLWDRDYEGDCEFSTRIDGVVVSTSVRDLREGEGVIIRDNKASVIVDKCRPHKPEESIAPWFSSQFPFGQSITTNFAGAATEPFEGAIPLIFGSHIGYIRPDQIEKNLEWIDQWKVILPMASSGDTMQDEQGRIVDVVLGEPIALAPGSACTQTYLVAGIFETKSETENYAYFLTTKLVRFLLLQRKTTQHVRPDRFRFVPRLSMKKRWDDQALYAHFDLTEEEIAHIEASIKPRSLILSLDSPIPATHLPGGAKYRAPGKDRETMEASDPTNEDDE